MQAKPTLEDTLSLMRDLRVRCEWDAAQTHESLRPYLIEEAFEVDDAIRAGNDAQLREELGDLLFQCTIAGVAEGFITKMKGRHPHLYGSGAKLESREFDRGTASFGQNERRYQAGLSYYMRGNAVNVKAGYGVSRFDRPNLPALWQRNVTTKLQAFVKDSGLDTGKQVCSSSARRTLASSTRARPVCLPRQSARRVNRFVAH